MWRPFTLFGNHNILMVMHSRETFMERDVRVAARWIGGSVVLAAIILAGGIHLSLSSQTYQLRQAMIEASEKNKPKDSIAVKLPDSITVKVQGGERMAPLLITGPFPDHFGYPPVKPLKVEVINLGK
jgi:hypothetical protein